MQHQVRSAFWLSIKASALFLLYSEVCAAAENGCKYGVDCTSVEQLARSDAFELHSERESDDLTQFSQIQATQDGTSTVLEYSAELLPSAELPRFKENGAFHTILEAISSMPKTRLIDVLQTTVASLESFLSEFRTVDPSIDSPVERRRLLELSVSVGTQQSALEKRGGSTADQSGVGEHEVATKVGASSSSLEPRDRASYMTRADFWKGFDCDALFREPRPIHNETTWAFLRGVYLGLVGAESTLQDSPYGAHGFQKSVVVKQSPGKGRGVFANEFIARGELIWVTTQEARFYSGEMYRQFLASIPDDLVCDVMQLTYIQETEESLLERYPDLYADVMIAVDLDEGGLVNSDWETKGDAQNIGFYRDLDDADEEEPWYASSQHYVALTDIQVGEELLSNYDEVTEEEWRDFGL